jgi:hypothetical protein
MGFYLLETNYSSLKVIRKTVRDASVPIPGEALLSGELRALHSTVLLSQRPHAFYAWACFGKPVVVQPSFPDRLGSGLKELRWRRSWHPGIPPQFLALPLVVKKPVRGIGQCDVRKKLFQHWREGLPG